MTPGKLKLRPITDHDLPFLNRLYHSTREEEMALVNWSQAEKEAFLTMQFNHQHTYYQQQYHQASFDIIELDEQPIGRLYLERRQDEYRIVDIALLPAFRRRGIGSKYLKEILSQAQKASLPVRIHVENNNPAMGLYQRLGFQKIDENGVYHLMEWQPD